MCWSNSARLVLERWLAARQLRRTVGELFYELIAPPRLLAGAHVPGIGLADNLEMASVPQLPSISEAIRSLARIEP